MLSTRGIIKGECVQQMVMLATTHVSVLVHVVVGQLDLVECDVILHPVGSTRRTVGVHIKPAHARNRLKIDSSHGR
jgi:hypothetical protein